MGGHRSGAVRWGQHFLAAPEVARGIVAWANVRDEVVLEIGPGRGALTDLLATQCRRLILVEIDAQLATLLRARFAADDRVTVIEADVLELDIDAAVGEPMHVVGNLPYESGTAIVTRLLERSRFVTDIVAMLQREVCQRLLAQPGSKRYGLLTVMTLLRADVEPGMVVRAGAFRPAPKVESQVVRIRPLGRLRYPVGNMQVFREMVSVAFAQRRKMLCNSLGPWMRARLGGCDECSVFAAARVDARLRPEAVELERMAALSCVVCARLAEASGDSDA